MTAVLRAHAALREAGLIKAGRLEHAKNSVNEVWFIGDYVLRINPDTERRRLDHEAKVLEVLARELPVPALIGYGQAYFGEWLVVRRVAGEELSRRWLKLDDHHRERAINSLGEALQKLHQIDAAAAGLDPPPWTTEDSLECPHQLPVSRLLDLLARADQLRFVDAGVIRAAVQIVLDAEDALDDASPCLVHGDLHFENVLVDEWALAALIDFEWTRPGPPDLDLDVLLHSLADPELHVAGDDNALPKRRDFDHVTSWLRSAYPALFAHPRLIERLTVYRLSYDVRELLKHPPDQPSTKLSPHHPYRRVQRIVEGRSDLGWILAG